jgi:hypothetical protein
MALINCVEPERDFRKFRSDGVAVDSEDAVGSEEGLHLLAVIVVPFEDWFATGFLLALEEVGVRQLVDRFV